MEKDKIIIVPNEPTLDSAGGLWLLMKVSNLCWEEVRIILGNGTHIEIGNRIINSQKKYSLTMTIAQDNKLLTKIGYQSFLSRMD